VHKRMAGMGVLLASTLVGGLAGFAGEPAAPGLNPATRPAGVPAEAAVWVVVPAPKASLDRLKKLVEAFQPGAGAMVEMLIRQGSPWNFEEADDTKPVIAVCQLPKKQDQKPPWAIAGSLKAGTDHSAALEKRFGGKPAKTEGEISVFTQVQAGALPDKEVYASAKGGRLILGDSKELVKLLAGCPAPAEGAYPAGADLLGGVDIKALAAQYKDKIEEGLEDFQEGFKEGLALGLGAAGNGEKLAEATGKFLADRARAALKEVELLGAQVRLGDTVALAFSARAVAGSEFAGWLAEAEKVSLPGTKLLPEGGMISAAVAIPPERLAKFFEAMLKPFGEALAGDEKTKKAFDDAVGPVTAYLKATDGTSAVTLYRRGGGLCQVGYAGVKDQAAARAAALKLLRFLESGPLADVFGKLGFKYALKEKARESGGLTVDRISTDFKPPADPNMPAELQETQKKMMEKMFGLPMTQDLAFSKDRGLFAMGKEAEPALDELVARSVGAKPGTEAMAGTLKAAPKGAFVAGEMYMLDYMKLVMDLAGEAGVPMPKLDLPKDADKTPITGYLASDGGELKAELRVPVEPIKKLVEAFKKMQADMMQNQPAVPLPAPGLQME